jgi:hypothetical protein
MKKAEENERRKGHHERRRRASGDLKSVPHQASTPSVGYSPH